MRRSSPVPVLALLLAFVFVSTRSLLAQVETPRGYYRFPALHEDTIVFTAEGDLWRVPASGGAAQRLTTHPGAETHAAISRDGQLLAFTGQYEGQTEVYVMPLAGGAPRRLTYEGETPGAQVRGWTLDGQVIYSTRHYSTLPNAQLVTA
jgi:tricorn protease